MIDDPNENDYYFDENGLLVFTREYHLKRGYCCGNGCRHCPYEGEMKKTSPDKKSEKIQKTKNKG